MWGTTQQAALADRRDDSMSRPVPTEIFHFTHLDNLARVAQLGLRCDTQATDHQLLITECGEPSIKDKRRRRTVTVGGGGVVANYVPFYFAPCSPMLYSIQAGNVPSFNGDSHDLVYLASTVEGLVEQGVPLVFTDRNAVTAFARHTTDVDDLDTLVDWRLMRARYWANTLDDPDRKERRMAECLAHLHVPWTAIKQIAVFDDVRKVHVERILDSVAVPQPPIVVRPGYYF